MFLSLHSLQGTDNYLTVTARPRRFTNAPLTKIILFQLFDVFALVFMHSHHVYNALKATRQTKHIIRVKSSPIMTWHITLYIALSSVVWAFEETELSTFVADEGKHSSFHSIWRNTSVKGFSLMASTLMTFAPSEFNIQRNDSSYVRTTRSPGLVKMTTILPFFWATAKTASHYPLLTFWGLKVAKIARSG